MNATVSGPSVRAARESAKLSQSAVAQALGMNRMYYSLFEAGRYVLDEKEQAALHEFLKSRGIEPSSGSNRNDGTTASAESEAASDISEVPSSDDLDEPDQATFALIALKDVAESSGRDSKRTAAAVLAASTALQALDYDELLDIADSLETGLEGPPDEATFSVLPIDHKLLWESRAAGMLVCSSLYGDAWMQTNCHELRVIREAIRKRVNDKEWNVRECGLFESDDKYLPDLRCHLAPYIAKAAEQRRAPALT